MGITEEQLARALFRDFSKDEPYGTNDKHQAHLLDQYKLYVEMADRVSARRLTANNYFLSVNTGLLGLVAYVAKESISFLWVLGIAGIVLCWLWYQSVSSYRDLNTAKFAIIHAIEKSLPLSPYSAEWLVAGRGKDPKRYFPLTHVEIGVPFVFMTLHGFVFLRTLPWTTIRSWFCP
mgnify:CR=1 FL=1